MKTKKGFTLIELLVVASIVSLLSSIGMAATNAVRAKARDAKRQSDIATLQKALELYFDAEGQYPSSALPPFFNPGHQPTTNNPEWNELMNLLDPYLSGPVIPPGDNIGFPGIPSQYGYTYFSNANGTYGPCVNKWYILVYRLESSTVSSPGVMTCEGANSRLVNYAHPDTTTVIFPGTITVGVDATK